MTEQPTTPTVHQVTVKYIQQQIAQMILFIEVTHDYEQAHLTEDALLLDVLRAIAADRCDDAKACAAEAIKSDRLAYPRWKA